ncbi:MAG: bacteriohemerythrin [Myxococcales bacterium]|nr:bacteriohemerythrin [Myxococcales bacterium]
MKNLTEEAREHARAIASMTGHTERDWTVLSQVSGTTTKWAPRLARDFVNALAANPKTAPHIKGKKDARESSLTNWFEQLLSGKAAPGFWSECCMVGLAHAAAGVPPAMVLAGARRVEEIFLVSVMASFGPEEAMRVHTAFARTLATAIAVMSAAAEDATRDTLAQMDIEPTRFQGRLRFDIQGRVRAARAELPRLEWDDSLSVGVTALDDQHKQLFELLDELQQATTEDREAALRQEIVGDLVEYTKIHFAFEETMLSRNGFPELEPHRAAHSKLAEQVDVYARAADAGAGPLGADLYFFLRTWLNGHIRGSDRRYGPFLNQRGVS